MLKKVLRLITDDRLVASGDTVVVAVSGGVDSVALLDILSRLTSLRLNLVVAHLNHGLRGKESDEDELFVREVAARYGLPVCARRADVRTLATGKGLSLEEAGREERYRFFAEVAARHGGAPTALAHHRDDQAETVLMRLLRGSAGSGLCGMRAKSREGKIIRPLLDVTRAEIEAYVTLHALSFRTDKSNADTAFLRNRIRHLLLPALAAYNPKISRLLAATADALAEDEAILNELVDAAYDRLATVGTSGICLVVSGVKEERKGLRLRLYRRTIVALRGEVAGISARHLADIDSLVLSSRPQAAVALPGALAVSRCYGELLFGPASGVETHSSYCFEIEGPGTYPLPHGGRLTIDVTTALPPFTSSRPGIDLDKAPFPWEVRTFRPGDRMIPLGMTGRKKVKDLFIDEKVPSWVRYRTPLLVSGTTIIWVGGVRVAEECRVTEATHLVAMPEILDFTH